MVVLVYARDVCLLLMMDPSPVSREWDRYFIPLMVSSVGAVSSDDDCEEDHVSLDLVKDFLPNAPRCPRN